MQRINGIKLFLGEDESLLIKKVSKVLRVNPSNIKYFKIVKKSLDARDKSNMFYIYNVDVSLVEEKPQKPTYKRVNGTVTVVGSGPCGLFCALFLARSGVKVTLLERGASVEERAKINDKFFTTTILNTECNIQFGEGGAGTFSDGKLNTQVNNERIKTVLEEFVTFGAPEEITYLSKPHLGSDNLPKIVKNIRNEIIRLGGTVIFNAKVCDLVIEKGKLLGLTYKKDGLSHTIFSDKTVFAIGHSARDTFEMLNAYGVAMESKDFAVGFRIEHLQSEIGFAQYGKEYKRLPSADYKLVSHAGERDVFSFCMCPGGVVMPATSEENCVVTNGMSEYARDKVNANSAIVCKVTRADFIGEDPLSGVRFQRELENKAFVAGGENYKAPVQLVRDFLQNKESASFGGVMPSYSIGTTFYPLHQFFSKSITNSIALAVLDMSKKIKGFCDNGAIFTGVESRTSSPLRILRGENLQSVNLAEFYPAGEGAGYAGGITSAAADGIKVATAIIEQFADKLNLNE